MELDENNPKVDRVHAEIAEAAPEYVVLVPVHVLLEHKRRHDEDDQPREEVQEHHHKHNCANGHLADPVEEWPEQEPVKDQAAQEPALHVQGMFRDGRNPGVDQPGLQDEHERSGRLALRLSYQERNDQGNTVQRVDGHGAPQHIVQDALLLSAPLLRAVEDEPRQHEEPRDPREAEAKGREVCDGRFCVEVAGDHVHGCDTTGQAKREPVRSSLRLICGLLLSLLVNQGGLFLRLLCRVVRDLRRPFGLGLPTILVPVLELVVEAVGQKRC
mmetsp:Transcript_89146/g.252620  ORF Transcript_89146/g.252620 Transcript_89146/m.252620 type:complete len:272 (-) Transcript_89146:574-1389(-)